MNEVIFEFVIPDFSEITNEGKRMLLEKTVRHNGVWRVHKSDADCIFPSDFHAHKIDGAQTLDVYTGFIYCARTKIKQDAMPKKVMRFIYGEFNSSKEPEFQGKCADKSKFTYL